MLLCFYRLTVFWNTADISCLGYWKMNPAQFSYEMPNVGLNCLQSHYIDAIDHTKRKKSLYAVLCKMFARSFGRNWDVLQTFLPCLICFDFITLVPDILTNAPEWNFERSPFTSRTLTPRKSPPQLRAQAQTGLDQPHLQGHTNNPCHSSQVCSLSLFSVYFFTIKGKSWECKKLWLAEWKWISDHT